MNKRKTKEAQKTRSLLLQLSYEPLQGRYRGKTVFIHDEKGKNDVPSLLVVAVVGEITHDWRFTPNVWCKSLAVSQTAPDGLVRQSQSCILSETFLFFSILFSLSVHYFCKNRNKNSEWEKKRLIALFAIHRNISFHKNQLAIMDRPSRMLLRKIIIDFLCICIVGFSVLAFFLLGKPYPRGYFCNDESINYPFKGSTVTSEMLYVVGIFLPMCVIVGGEYLHGRNSNGQPSVMLFGKVIPPWLSLAYNKIGLFGFGAVSVQFTTDIAKYTIGRLRPHFLDVCQPKSGINCSLLENQNVYVIDFECTATNSTARMLKDARLSFPSGHSSFSAYAMVYLALYLQLRMTWNGSKLLKNVLQLICLWLAWFTAMSRISDYKHHWSDVLAGLILGITGALIMVFGVADFFKERQSSPSPNTTTMHPEKLTAIDYDVEPGMQDETSPLRRETIYGGITMTQGLRNK